MFCKKMCFKKQRKNRERALALLLGGTGHTRVCRGGLRAGLSWAGLLSHPLTLKSASCCRRQVLARPALVCCALLILLGPEQQC
jgi:hypothetical protein